MPRILPAALPFLFLLLSCQLQPDNDAQAQQQQQESGRNHGRKAISHSTTGADNHFPETFDYGHKTAYATADVPLATGPWRLDNALIGSTDADHKDGHAALRFKSGDGTITTLFAVGSIKQVTLSYASYGDDDGATLALWYSPNGNQWGQAGADVTAAGSDLKQVTFDLPSALPLRLQLRKTGHGRLNVDDFNIITTSSSPAVAIGVPASGDSSSNTSGGNSTATREDNMALGNPSNATASSANKNNYLLVKRQYALSYNNSKGMANWVSWHLSLAWRGSAQRCNCFMSDETLPNGFFKATTSNYIGTGFDRGHLCPSDDRTASDADNTVTFLMSNMSPQAPNLNQKTWEKLEEYSRTLTGQGHELYIIAGGYGTGGTGRNGGLTNSIADGAINVPARFWKIVVVLPTGSSSAAGITKDTRVIAVDMPNVQSVSDKEWGEYRTSVAAIEQASGYKFFSTLPAAVQTALKEKVDNGDTQ